MKSETGSLHPLQFVGLRPKMYSLLVPEIDLKKVKMTAKGVKKSYVKQNLKHNDYLETLETGDFTTAEFNIIRSVNHVVQTARINKKCLAAFDDKRYVLSDCVHTLAYGHYSI